MSDTNNLPFTLQVDPIQQGVSLPIDDTLPQQGAIEFNLPLLNLNNGSIDGLSTANTIDLGLGDENNPNSSKFLGSIVNEKGKRETLNQDQLINRNEQLDRLYAQLMMNQFRPSPTAPIGSSDFYSQILGRSIGFKPKQIEGINDSQQQFLQRGNIARGIFSGLGLGLSTTKNILSGIGQEKRKQFVFNENLQRLREGQVSPTLGSEDLFNNFYQQFYGIGFKYGGEVVDSNDGYKVGEDLPFEQIMSQRSITGLDEDLENQANAEVEKGEYIYFPDGQISKVEGEKHSKGGEKMLLPEGTKIISDNLKLGKEDANFFSEMLGIKIKPTTTYANIVDTFQKRSGMLDTKLEQERFFKMLEKNQQVDDESTRALNEEYISENINRLEVEKESFNVLNTFFVDLVFEKQEDNKKQNEKIEDVNDKEKNKNKYGFKDNSVSITENDKIINIPLEFKNGGVYTKKDSIPHFKKWMVANGFKNVKHASDELLKLKYGGQVNKNIPKYKDGDLIGVKRLNDGTFSVTVEGEDNDRVLSRLELLNEFKPDELKKFDDSRTINLLGNPNNDPSTFVENQEIDSSTGVSGNARGTEQERLQTLSEHFPNLVDDAFDIKRDEEGKIVNYTINNDNTIKFQKGVQEIYNSNRDFLKTFLPNDQFKLVEDFINTNQFDDAKVARAFDGLFGNFTSSRVNLAVQFISDTDKIKIDNLGIRTVQQLINAVESGDITLDEFSKRNFDKLPDDFKGDFLLDSIPTPTIEEIEPTVESVNVNEPEFPSKAIPSTSSGLPLINQDPLPPDPLASHFFNIPALEKVTPIKVSPEEALRENNRLLNKVTDDISQNIGSQQGANIANTIGQISENNNKAVAEANRQNALMAAQSQQINVQQSNAQQYAIDKSLNRFDELQLTALSKTNTDVRNFFNRLIENRVQAQKEDLAFKILDSANPNFTIDPLSGIVFTGESAPLQFSNINQVALPAFNASFNQTSNS